MTQALTATTRAVRRLLRQLGPSKAQMTFAVVAMFAAGAADGITVGLLVPLLSMLTGSEMAAAGPLQSVLPLLASLNKTERILVLAGQILLFTALKNGMTYLGAALGGDVRKKALVELRRQLLERVLSAPPATLEAHTSGEVATVLGAEATRVNRALDYLVSFAQRAIMAISYFVAVLVLSWQLTMIAFVVGALLAGVSMVLGRRVLERGREFAKATHELGRQVGETVGGLRVIRTTGSETGQAERFATWNKAHATADNETQLVQTLQFGAVDTLGVLGAMIVTGVAYEFFLVPGAMDVSRFLAFAFGLLRLLPALNQAYAMESAVTSLAGSMEKTLRWLELPRYPSRPFGSRALGRIEHGVTFEDLSFSYPGGHEALRSVSCEIGAGETIAIVGASGSGKSTLASLLLRLREPTAGRILFDGHDYWDFDPGDFSRMVALVEQEPFLFNASLVDNVRFGAPAATREDVERAIELVRLGDLVRRLPEGIDTVISERGASLSGGQRQRLAIARAIVRDPQLLVLDEPTSALDAETEKEVVAAIDAASAGRTTIIITHRPSTVLHATRVLRVAQGQLETVRTQAPGARASAAEQEA